MATEPHEVGLVWECKVGCLGSAPLPLGADYPMRLAIKRAYEEITGKQPDFCFSGWSGNLNKIEMQIAEGKEAARVSGESE